MADQYDPTGEVAVWTSASDLVAGLKDPGLGGDAEETWNAAIEQAARALDLRARELRQANGLYYRAMRGM